jgi:hypothetical protein
MKIEKDTQKKHPITSDRFIKTSEVLKILACSRDFLIRLRVEGKLMPIIRSKTNHVYSLNDLERYIQQEKAEANSHRLQFSANNLIPNHMENLKLIGYFPDD